ncbi:MAC/Perforin domain-containing protein [Aneurinibacillus soli]|uniref:MACPF domain-containing protein n=1 Tax=Aneurinibacillus soli TaxID=1500254 RepID=A0A0U5BHY4_9BACL|nr:MAC/perforin domain-containing protein [Aneurinibacillus soli]PYE61397.1 MAC/Perforin domain-containing protein [Aneurinibacillus soli]BAU27774.1 hypothetical protein CB4_01948 [Aneurinibacillus soli]
MKVKSTVKLGTATNLLMGLNPYWRFGSEAEDALFRPDNKPLVELEIEINPVELTWSYPEVSLHDSVESLLDEVYPFSIENPSDGTKAPILPSGPLLIGDKDKDSAMKELSTMLGIDLSNPDYGYALVQLRRTVGTAEHPCVEQGIRINPNPARIPVTFGVDEAFRKKLTMLRPCSDRAGQFSPDNITKDIALDYLDFYQKYGTHFVSRVTTGDIIFQIFAYPSYRFQKVKKAYEKTSQPISGPDAISFRYFTTNATTGTYGYVKEYSRILSFSGDKMLKQSIEAGEWQEANWAETTSIFAPFQEDTLVSLDRLDEECTQTVVTGIELTSLSLFAEHNRTKAWTRIFKSAIVQKYKGRIPVDFVPYCTCDMKTKLPQGDIPGFISTIATPTINVYKPTLDLSQMQFVAKEVVKTGTFFANILHCSEENTIHLPGTDVAMTAQVIDMAHAHSLPILALDDTAFASFMLSCRRFLGAMMVRNETDTKHYTIVDGLTYVLCDGLHHRYSVTVETDIRTVPHADLLARFASSIEFSYVFAQSLLNGATATKQVREFAKNALLWLSEVIPEDTTELELAELRVRALDLAKTASDPIPGAFVPLLPYSDYEKQVHAILDFVKEINEQMQINQEEIERRKQSELIIDVAKKMNENIIQSGELLAKVIEASAAQQSDLAAYYGSIVAQKKTEYERQQQKMDELEIAVQQQQSEVREAVENYKQALKDWQTREWIKFGLDIATNLFDAGTTVLIPAKSITSVKELGLTVQRMKKVLGVLNSTFKLYTSANTSVESIKNAQASLDGVDEMDTMANLAWDEMSQHMKAILATAPSDPEVNRCKARLDEAFGILVLRGKALASTKSSARDLARDIYIQQKQQIINEAQRKRLSDLQGYLKPEKIGDLQLNKIDLIGLTGHLTSIQNQMMGILAEAFLLQDQALQYQFLQPATNIDTFDLPGFRSALARQETNKIKAKTLLNQYQTTTTTPIDVEIHGVVTDQLIGGNVFQVAIQPDALEFLKYVQLRVVAVTAKIDGIASTDSGSYLINLACQGAPFYDRDAERNARMFTTLRRERTYEYEVGTNQPKFIDEGMSWSEDVNPITPFTIWEMSLPNTKCNQGIRFKDHTVTITLSFTLKARIKDAPARRLLMAAAGAPSAPDIVARMYQQGSSLNNWDVVFNMTLDKINDTLQKQYIEYKNNDTQFGGKISADIKTQIRKNKYAIKKIDMEYGYPSVTFLPNNNQHVQLEMQITGGTLTECEQKEGEQPECDPTVSIKKGILQAVVPIEKIKGVVEGQSNDVYSVALNLEQGSFSAKGIELSDEESLDMSDGELVAFNEGVKAYFETHKISYIINSLDLSNITTLEDLRPHEFYFKTLKTQSGNEILQLFIQTANRTAFDYSQTFLNKLPEPIPQGAECSLLVNSRIFFDKIIPASMDKGGWNIKGSNPNDPDKAWYSYFTEGLINGNIDLSRLDNRKTYTAYGSSKDIDKKYWIPGGNNVAWSISGMTIIPSPEGRLKLGYSQKQTQSFTEKVCERVSIGDWHCTENSLSTDFNMSISATLPLSIGGTGRDQKIQIRVSNQSIDVDGRTSGGGPCGSDDLQAQVNQALKDQIPGQVADKINVDFEPVSVFALKNLLFPSKNYINLTEVYAPGDLVIFGNFTSES